MSIQNMYSEPQPVVIQDCEFTNQLDEIINQSKIDDETKAENADTTNIIVTKYADPASDVLDVEPTLELDSKGKIIEVELLPSSRLRNIQNKNHLTALLNKSVVKKIQKRKLEGSENKKVTDNEIKKKKIKHCSTCGKEYNKNHELFCKPDGEYNKTIGFALCSKCGKHFSSNYNLKRHMTSCKLCPDDEKAPRFTCQCGRTYSQEWDMKKHRLKCKDGKKKCKSCFVANCNLLFYHKGQLIEHMKKDHKMSIQDPEVLNFNSFDDFLLWKEREEEETYTYYSKQTGSNVTGVSVNTYYVCQHDGSDRAHSSAPRKTERRNKKGRIKTGRLCWSQMNVKQFKDGSVRVTYFPSHTHPLSIADTEHHPLPSSITMEIKRRLSELEPGEVAHFENQEFKKGRKKRYGMTLRTLRALARKNRSLFRITAEAIQKTDGGKAEVHEEKPSVQFSSKYIAMDENNLMQVFVADQEENVDDPEEMQCDDQNREEMKIDNLSLYDNCYTHLNDLKSLIESGKLDESQMNQLNVTLKNLVSKCKEVAFEEQQPAPSQPLPEIQEAMYQAQSPLPTAENFPNHEDVESEDPLKPLTNSPEKTIYQLIAVDSEETSPNTSEVTEILYQNAVELVGARQVIIIAGDHAQFFQGVDTNAQFDLT